MPTCIAVATLACGGDAVDLPDKLAATTAHFEYYTRAGAPFCPDLPERIESHFAAVQSFLALTWPAGRRVRYYRFADSDDARASRACRGGAFDACADASSRQSVVYTVAAMNRHELVHAYLASVGFPSPVYAEGLAEVLSCDPRPSRTARGPDWRAELFLVDGAGEWAGYEAAALLARRLLDKYGPTRVMEAYARSAFGTNPDAFAREFALLFPDSLQVVWDEARTARYPDGVHRLCLCDGQRIAIDAEDAATSACDGAAATVTEGVFSLDSPALAFVDSLQRAAGGNPPRLCLAGTAPTLDSMANVRKLRELAIARLEPGRYYVYDAERLRVTTASRDDLSCASAPRYDLDASRDYSNIRVAATSRGPETSFVELGFPRPQLVDATSAGGALLCDACPAPGSTDGCAPIANRLPPGGEVSGPQLLRLDSDRSHWMTFRTEPTAPAPQVDAGR